jgi:glycosyltransferase involved in cell wall biosynthesis
MKKISILITSPSVNTRDNVSGIANLTGLLIQHNEEVDYYHFITGKKDSTSRNASWLCKQCLVPFKFIHYLIMNYRIEICHFNVPQEDYAIIREGVLVIIAKLMRKKIIVHLRGGKYNKNEIEKYFIKKFFNVVLLLSNKIICLSVIEKTYIIQYYGIESLKIVALPNAVKVSDDILKKDYSGTLKILFLGRIEKDKGLNEIIAVLKNLNSRIDYQFLLCGTGTYEKFVTEELNKSVPDKFINCGIVSGDKKANILGEAHIYLLPSYYEGLPNALLEAMAYGAVPICTPAGSVSSVIRDKKNGFLVPMYSADAIQEIIIDLNEDRRKLEAISEIGYRDIKRKYPLSNYILSLNEIYSGLRVKSA